MYSEISPENPFTSDNLYNIYNIDENNEILDNLSIMNKETDVLLLRNTMSVYGFIFT